MNFCSNEGLTPIAIEKLKILGAVYTYWSLDEMHCQFSPFALFLCKWAGVVVLFESRLLILGEFN